MEKQNISHDASIVSAATKQGKRRYMYQASTLAAAILIVSAWKLKITTLLPDVLSDRRPHCHEQSVYGKFPRHDDPFQFLPCTSWTVPPPLNDTNHRDTWAKLFDPDPNHWSWGSPNADTLASAHANDHFSGRGIYLCGYFDVPLDYTNGSDERIARLAVTKYQVSGLAHKHSSPDSPAGRKSARTLVIEPGGPGGSGTSYLWRAAETVTQRLSNGTFDVLGWDPRGVNQSLPAISCFPFAADRDRWSLVTQQHRAAVTSSPNTQLELTDAMNEAIFAACKETLGDLPRFMSTAFVARDVDRLLSAMDESHLDGYFVSYGTGIGQTFANMFPDRVGRLILDGTEYVRDHRLVGGFGWTALDNGTDAWNDGFLGECVAAGPENCALAKSGNALGGSVTLTDLQARMSKLLKSLAARPLPAFTSNSGPSLITYSSLVDAIYQTMYNPFTWPTMAQALYDLEQGNTTLIAQMLDRAEWEYEPGFCEPRAPIKVSSDELGTVVICADSYDSIKPWTIGGGQDGVEDDLLWWSDLWHNMSSRSWLAGNSRFYDVLPCRHFNQYFGSAAEVYRGDLNHSLSNPVLLIAEAYDPATPLRNGRRLLQEMGKNARLVAHHGYGHSSRDTSACTDRIAREYIMEGKLPDEQETACYADGKPYRYNDTSSKISSSAAHPNADHLAVWREHMREMQSYFPR